MKTPELIAQYGYNGETHSVTTEDGYTLDIHRISGGPKSPPRKGKKVVFLMHGLRAMSDEWVMTGPNHAQGFQLADEGYDVWMGNARGTDYSLNHTTYKPFGNKNQQKHFWSFSWHEMGVYDVPAMIDYVLAHTGQQKLQYVGHSQGCAVYFVMMSEKPEYNEKIEMAHVMAPAVFIKNIKTKALAMVGPKIKIAKKLNQITEIYYFTSAKKMDKICMTVRAARKPCSEDLNSFMGSPSDQTDLDQIPIIYGHFASQAGTNQAIHFGQSIESGKFRKFDYGNAGNQLRYGQNGPPAYKLENAKAPVAVYYGESDWFVVPKDVKRLISELPNVVLDYPVPHKKFNHGDFMYGKDARSLVFDKVLEMIRSTE